MFPVRLAVRPRFKHKIWPHPRRRFPVFPLFADIFYLIFFLSRFPAFCRHFLTVILTDEINVWRRREMAGQKPPFFPIFSAFFPLLFYSRADGIFQYESLRPKAYAAFRVFLFSFFCILKTQRRDEKETRKKRHAKKCRDACQRSPACESCQTVSFSCGVWSIKYTPIFL